MTGSGLLFHGWMFPAEGNVFVTLQDMTGFTPMSLIFRGVSLPRAMVLDGLLLLAARDAGRTPAAIPILLERIGDLSGVRGEDDLRCAALAENEENPVDSIPEEAKLDHLLRDIGPSAAAKGGELFLVASGRRSLSKGMALSGTLKG